VANSPAKFTAMVDFPQPPFKFATVIIFGTDVLIAYQVNGVIA
jgi:hypothetical protein